MTMHLTHLKFRRNKLGHNGAKASLKLKLNFIPKQFHDIFSETKFDIAKKFVKSKGCTEEFESDVQSPSNIQ